MTRRDDGPGTVSAEEVSKGCRRIVGFMVGGWVLFGIASAFIRDSDIDIGPLGAIGFLDIAIVVAIVGFVIRLVARRNSAGSDQSAEPEPTEPKRRVESIQLEHRPPPSPETPPTRIPRTPPPFRAEEPPPAPGATSPPQTLEEALEELGNEPSRDALEQFDVDLDVRPKSSQEMIEEARRKWGKDRGR